MVEVEGNNNMGVPQFGSHLFTVEIEESVYNIRVLTMHDSLFIYIGAENKENLEEIGVAMPVKNSEVVSTTIIGSLIGCDSQDFANKIAKRLDKQVYISYNIQPNNMVTQKIEKLLSEKIKSCRGLF